MNPTTTAPTITDRLTLVLETMERGDDDALAQLVWRAAITDAIAHIATQDSRIDFLEHMRSMLHEEAAT